MKKRKSWLIAVLLVTVMVVSVVITGCTSNASDSEIEDLKARLAELEESKDDEKVEEEKSAETQEETEDKGESAEQEAKTEEEEYDPAADEALWGTKRLESSIVTYGSDEDEIIYEYNEDGSYTGRMQGVIADNRKDIDVLYYFSSKGIPTKIETYKFSAEHPDGELDSTEYYYLGVPLGNDVYGKLYEMVMFDCDGWNWSFGKQSPDLRYDDDAKITNEQGLICSNGDMAGLIEKDENERLTKVISKTETSNETDENFFLVYSEFSYDDNAVFVRNYSEYPNSYDVENRTVGYKESRGGKKIVFDSHGMPVKAYLLNGDGEVETDSDGNANWSSVELLYDVYGHFIGWENGALSVENTYEDGTVTSLENDGRSGHATKKNANDEKADEEDGKKSENESSTSSSGSGDIIGKWVGDGMDLSDYTFKEDGTGEDYFYPDGVTTYFNWTQKGNEIETTDIRGNYQSFELKDGKLYDSWGNKYEKQ